MVDEVTPSDTAFPRRVFLQVEHGVYTALGVLLAMVAIVALAHAALDVVSSIVAFSDNKRLLSIMDQLLVVLMLAEILHTVRASMRSGSLTAEPFLVVGLIASIRRVLVITLESSDATKLGGGSASEEGVFHHSMLELGVLGMLILVMVVSIFLLRRASPASASQDAGGDS